MFSMLVLLDNIKNSYNLGENITKLYFHHFFEVSKHPVQVFFLSQQTKHVSFHSKQRQVVSIALLLGFLSLHFSATRINEIFHLWFSYGNRFRLMQTIGLFHWIWTLTD